MSSDQPDSQMEAGSIKIEPGLRLQYGEPGHGPPIPEAMEPLARKVIFFLREYRSTCGELLKQRFALLRERVPAHMTSPHSRLALLAEDGIVVRWEPVTPGATPMISVGWFPGRLEDCLPKVSDGVLCYLDAGQAPDFSKWGKTLHVIQGSPGAPAREVIRLQVVAPAFRVPPSMLSDPRQMRPIRSGAAGSVLDLEFAGQRIAGEASSARDEGGFSILMHVSLQVPWTLIEVYPDSDPASWAVENAQRLAEHDLLLNSAVFNLRRDALRRLDPHADARREFAKLLADLEIQLRSCDEEPLHQFLLSHPVLLSPSHAAIRSKIRLGDRVTDFVIREATGDYLLVEIESPAKRLFRKDGQSTSALTQATTQVQDWWRYIEDNKRTVEAELDLPGISAHPPALIVMGRSADLTERDRRKLVTMRNHQPTLTILTYDDLLDRARQLGTNVLGPLSFCSPGVEVYLYPAGSLSPGSSGSPTTASPEQGPALHPPTGPA